MVEDRRGWIRLVEAFASILLIGVLVVLIASQQATQKDTVSEAISSYEVYMLRSVELNESLREEITGVAIPVSWSEDDFPAGLKSEIANITPAYLSCEAKICRTNESCIFDGEITSDIYAQRIFISSNYQNYNPRQLKLFCRTK